MSCQWSESQHDGDSGDVAAAVVAVGIADLQLGG